MRTSDQNSQLETESEPQLMAEGTVLDAHNDTQVDIQTTTKKKLDVVLGDDFHMIQEKQKDDVPQKFSSLAGLVETMRSADFDGTLMIENFDDLEKVLSLPPHLITGLRIKTHNPEVKAALKSGVKFGRDRLTASTVLRGDASVEVTPATPGGRYIEPTFEQAEQPSEAAAEKKLAKKFAEIRERLEQGKKVKLSLPDTFSTPEKSMLEIVALAEQYPTLLRFTDETAQRLARLANDRHSAFFNPYEADQVQIQERLKKNVQLRSYLQFDADFRREEPVMQIPVQSERLNVDEPTAPSVPLPVSAQTAEVRNEETKQSTGRFGRLGKLITGSASVLKSGWGRLVGSKK